MEPSPQGKEKTKRTSIQRRKEYFVLLTTLLFKQSLFLELFNFYSALEPNNTLLALPFRLNLAAPKVCLPYQFYKTYRWLLGFVLTEWAFNHGHSTTLKKNFGALDYNWGQPHSIVDGQKFFSDWVRGFIFLFLIQYIKLSCVF